MFKWPIFAAKNLFVIWTEIVFLYALCDSKYFFFNFSGNSKIGQIWLRIRFRRKNCHEIGRRHWKWPTCADRHGSIFKITKFRIFQACKIWSHFSKSEPHSVEPTPSGDSLKWMNLNSLVKVRRSRGYTGGFRALISTFLIGF